jgi:hypothetical protein
MGEVRFVTGRLYDANGSGVEVPDDCVIVINDHGAHFVKIEPPYDEVAEFVYNPPEVKDGMDTSVEETSEA